MMPRSTEPERPLVGARLKVTIHDVAFGGAGVARYGDLVVFVPFTIPGEEAEVEVTDVRKHFVRAALRRLLRSAPSRAVPACRYFGDCGGCQYQHIDYPAQLAIKQKQIRDLLERVGKLGTLAIDPVKPCPQPYGYRNRIMVRSQWHRDEHRLRVGFLRHDNRLVVDIDQCRIAEPLLNDQLLELRRHPPPRGGLKVVLRVVPDDWEVPRDSFFQNNFHLLPELLEVVRARLRESGARHLVDAYCGVGFFAIGLAGQVESFTGIEQDRLAVAAARSNAQRHGHSNGQFLQGTVEDALPGLLDRLRPERTALIIDPPRKGCHPAVVELLQRCRPTQVLYVSCHPATLARDLQTLCANEVYRVSRVTPLDMFPQTQHVECVVDLRVNQPCQDARHGFN